MGEEGAKAAAGAGQGSVAAGEVARASRGRGWGPFLLAG